MKAVSLFACGGIGDLALRELGIKTVVANELLLDRAEVFKYNHPNVDMVIGDINEHKNEIVRVSKKHDIDIVFATPPCQGMSKNGRGKLLQAIRNGKAPKIDQRNLLIVPTIEIVKELNADTLLLENVPEMLTTYINDPVEGGYILIIDYICRELEGYHLEYRTVNFADYGVAQSRERLIVVVSRRLNILNNVFSSPTHSKEGSDGKEKWLTLRDVIQDFPKLDAKDERLSKDKDDEYHRVPLLDKDKYFWVQNTPENKSAFDNQCVQCGFDQNPTHKNKLGKDGINRSSLETPIRCIRCGSLLPRPWVVENGEYRLMKGYTSAYKRMAWDSPSSTITTNFSYACSDNKLHPEQNRVLSISEVMAIHTLNAYDFKFKRADGVSVGDTLIRKLIGESIPPKGLERILVNLKKELGYFE